MNKLIDITIALFLLMGFSSIAFAQNTSNNSFVYTAPTTGSDEVKRDATTTLDKTGGNPDINQTISTDDYIVDKDFDAEAPKEDESDSEDEVDPSFNEGSVVSGDVEDYVDLDALEERAHQE